ncbi:unnamed protein product, partial [Pleuronectes platessa]
PRRKRTRRWETEAGRGGGISGRLRSRCSAVPVRQTCPEPPQALRDSTCQQVNSCHGLRGSLSPRSHPMGH